MFFKRDIQRSIEHVCTFTRENCTNLGCKRVRDATCLTVHLFTLTTSTFTRVVSFTFYYTRVKRVHDDRCDVLQTIFVQFSRRNVSHCTIFFVRVSILIRVVLYNFLLHTCPCWHVSHCANFHFSSIDVYTCLNLHIFWYTC